MLIRFHAIHPKEYNFTQKNGILPQILCLISFLTKIILKKVISLHAQKKTNEQIGDSCVYKIKNTLL